MIKSTEKISKTSFFHLKISHKQDKIQSIPNLNRILEIIIINLDNIIETIINCLIFLLLKFNLSTPITQQVHQKSVSGMVIKQ